MPEFQTLVAVALAGFALSASPGPSMLYVLSRSVGQGPMAGIASAIGLALGGVLLAVATALGLAALFSTFEWIVPLLRGVGSIYLAWLGFGMIRDAYKSAGTKLSARDVRPRTFSQIVGQGVLVELLNPKTVLFFALFLPPFVDAGADASVGVQLLVLGILVPLTAVPSDIVVAWMGGSMADFMNRNQTVQMILAWMGGLTLMAISASLALQLFR